MNTLLHSIYKNTGCHEHIKNSLQRDQMFSAADETETSWYKNSKII
jgi:hypothetical protein